MKKNFKVVLAILLFLGTIFESFLVYSYFHLKRETDKCFAYPVQIHIDPCVEVGYKFNFINFMVHSHTRAPLQLIEESLNELNKGIIQLGDVMIKLQNK